MARASVRAGKTTKAARELGRILGRAPVERHRTCHCSCHDGHPGAHPGEKCICKRVRRGLV